MALEPKRPVMVGDVAVCPLHGHRLQPGEACPGCVDASPVLTMEQRMTFLASFGASVLDAQRASDEADCRAHVAADRMLEEINGDD